MKPLYELTGAYLTLLGMIDDEEDEQAIYDTLEAIDGEIEEKADGYAKIIRQLEGQADMVKAEKERLYKKETAYRNYARNLKTRLEESMIALDKKKFKTDLFSFGIQNNAPSAVVEDEERFLNWALEENPELVRIKKEVDKKQLLDLLKKGADVPYARMQQTESLRIR